MKANPDSLFRSISVTSRPPRNDEVNGESYHFVSRAEFEHRIAGGDFFEWEEVHGNYYGTLKSTLDTAVKSGKDLLLIIEIRGALNIKEHYPDDTVVVFMTPPDSATLKKRLRGRGRMSAREESLRFETARFEYGKLIEFADLPGRIDYFVVNDDAGQTYEGLDSILKAERQKLQRMEKNEIEKICRI